MSETVKTVTESSVRDVARRAKAASRLLALLPRARRNEVLYAAADEICLKSSFGYDFCHRDNLIWDFFYNLLWIILHN